ncbi:MAG: CehA/McbA family metallohydrolase [Planctomycetota bacterium]
MPLVTYKGALHIHTRYSDGSGRLPEIIAAARQAQLDFIVLSDHNRLDAKRDGWEGWHDGVLVIVGAEISPRRAGHVVALGVEDVKGYEHLSEGEYLRAVARQGGVSFIAHPEGKRKVQFNVNLERWRHWDTNLFAGMEIWSFMHDWIKDLHVLKLRRFHRDPLGQIAGPDPWVLAAWDALASRRPVSGVAGLDVHARRLLLRAWTFFPYEFMFRTTLTYVRAPAFTGRPDDDIPTVIRALVRGSAFVAYEILGDASAFDFHARSADSLIPMGTATTIAPQALELRVLAPAPSEIRLLCAGRPVTQTQGTDLVHRPTAPGPYRVEIYRDERPWIFSNPIYLREPAP